MIDAGRQIIDSHETFHERLFKAPNLPALRLCLVNDLRTAVTCDRAVLFENKAKKLVAVSDVSGVERSAPFKFWAEKFVGELHKVTDTLGCFTVNPTHVSAETRRDWVQFSPPHILWLPVEIENSTVETALILARPLPWTESDIARVKKAVLPVSLCFKAHRGCRFSPLKLLMKSKTYVAATLLLSLFIPVRLSVLAPAEVAPREPFIVTAPFDGIVNQVLVAPDQQVRIGEPLAVMQTDELESQKAVAENALAIVEAQLLKVRQSGFQDIRVRADLAELEAQVALKQAELEFASKQLALANLVSPIDGIAVVQNLSDWQGRPVQVGERILVVANPERVKVEVMVSVKDSIAIEKGADVSVFLDNDPLTAIGGRVVYAGFEPETSIDGTPAFPVTVEIENNFDVPRIGLRGTARIKTERVSLGYYLFRRPLNGARQWLGL